MRRIPVVVYLWDMGRLSVEVNMNVLFLGDIVGPSGCNAVRERLSGIKKHMEINLAIANGENSAAGNGITPSSAEFLFESGIDIITTGNHVFKRKEVYNYLNECKGIIRPANYPCECDGRGFTVWDMGKYRVAVINLAGQVFMEPVGCPFRALDRILKKVDTNIIIIDFHAETTAEKGALVHYSDGKVSAVIGTHTHVQTADEKILPGGTGFISDAGMTGAKDSILGVRPEEVIKKVRCHVPVFFKEGEGDIIINSVFLRIDENSGKCTEISRLNF